MAGVGVGLSHRSGSGPLAASTRADSAANTSAMNLVSYPTTILVSLLFLLIQVAIACETWRTATKVNSSAIIARQPEVPNFIIA
jgi:hypothetical protein